MLNGNPLAALMAMFVPPEPTQPLPTAEEVDAEIARVEALPINFSIELTDEDRKAANLTPDIETDAPWMIEEGIIALEKMRYLIKAHEGYINYQRKKEIANAAVSYEFVRSDMLAIIESNDRYSLFHRLTEALAKRNVAALDAFIEKNPTFFEELEARWERQEEEKKAEYERLLVEDALADEAGAEWPA